MPTWPPPTVIPVVVTAILAAVLTTVLVLGTAVVVALVGGRRLARRWTTQPASETPLHIPLSLSSTSWEDVLFTELRAESGDVALRPMGSRRSGPSLEVLDLVAAQLAEQPRPIDADIDLSVELCPHVPRSVRLELPVYVAGMGYGVALNRQAKLALALGSALAGTAVCSGEGAFLPEEPVLAYRWFYQVGRGAWTHAPDAVRRADLIEIHVGQGAEASAPLTKPPDRLRKGVRTAMGLTPDQPATVRSGLNWQGRRVTLRELVGILREFNPHVPVGVKLAASDALEADLEVAVAAGVDFIALDGEEAGTGNAPLGLSEAVGVALLPALARADDWLRLRGVRGRLALLASGGLRQPADFLKMLALGADAVGIGTAALIALAHRQFEAILPQPPSRLVSHGSDLAGRFNAILGAHSLANYLESCRKDMQLLLRTAGKQNVRQLTRADLCCRDRDLAENLRVRWNVSPSDPDCLALRRIRWAAIRTGDHLDSLCLRVQMLNRR
ncbi:MAG TPA: FMN-binding glutamate synthase family protein [Bacillota bacterium]